MQSVKVDNDLKQSINKHNLEKLEEMKKKSFKNKNQLNYW